MKRAFVIVLGCALAATAIAQPDPGSGSADPGSASGAPQDPGSGSGSAGSGSGATGSGSAGSGSGATGSGSGSAKGPVIIQIPTDVDAPQVSAAAAPTEVKLGGKFTLFVTATFVPGVVVNLPEPIDLGPAFEVTRKDSQDAGQPDGRTTREWQIEVIAWELGDLVVPPVRVTYTAQGKGMQTQTNASKVRVLGVLGDVVDDPKAMRTNAEPHDLLVRDWFWAWAAGGGLLLLIGLIWLALYIRARRRRVLTGGFVSSGSRKHSTPASRALEKLLAIETSGVLDRDDDRKHGYAEMVDVIRVYLGTRYRVATYDLTTYELMRSLKQAAPPGDARGADELKLIEHWLESCDIVKYGGHKATGADGKTTLDAARELVLTTSQTPEKPAAPPPPILASVEVSSSLASQVVADDASPAATKTGWEATRSQPVATRAASQADRSQATTHAETSQAARAVDDDAPTTEVAKVEPDSADTRDEIPAAAQEPLLSPEERARLERARWGRP